MIPILEFNIRNQTLSRIDSFRPAEKSVGYLHAKFNLLTDEWKNGSLKVRAKNRADQIVYEQEIVDGSCLIPWEALAKSGMFSVSVFCQNDDTEITTNAVDIGLSATLPGGSETNPPTPTELDEIREDIEQLREQVGTASVAPSDWLVNNETEPGYVKNRTHWVEKKFEPFGFDNGVIPDEYQIDLSALGMGIAYRISDKYLTKEQLDGATCYVGPYYGETGSGAITYSLTTDGGNHVFTFSAMHSAINEEISWGFLFSAEKTGIDSNIIDVPAPGVYIVINENSVALFNFEVRNEVYKKIDNEFLDAFVTPVVDLTTDNGVTGTVSIGSKYTFFVNEKVQNYISVRPVRVRFAFESTAVEVTACFSGVYNTHHARNYVLYKDSWYIVVLTLDQDRLTISVTEE